jgi:hypothetical protein
VRGFMRYLRERTLQRHPSYLQLIDPEVEICDGKVRILDQRGGEIKLHDHPVRVLRQLATQLSLCADEIERRSFEE